MDTADSLLFVIAWYPVVAVVAIIRLVVCQEEEFLFLYTDTLPTGRGSGNVGTHGIRGSHRATFWLRVALSTDRQQRHFPAQKH
jgi:hypothetical protein